MKAASGVPDTGNAASGVPDTGNTSSGVPDTGNALRKTSNFLFNGLTEVHFVAECSRAAPSARGPTDRPADRPHCY